MGSALGGGNFWSRGRIRGLRSLCKGGFRGKMLVCVVEEDGAELVALVDI